MNTNVSQIRMLVRRGVWRRNLVLVFERLPLASILALAGAVVTLLLGTDRLHWYLFGFLTIAGVALVGWHLWREQTTDYRVTQIIDRRLKLDDSLSTAWYLLSPEQTSPGHADHFSVAMAAKLTRSVNPARAFPFPERRVWVAPAVLFIAACGLFVLRYAREARLDLRRPLITVQTPSALAQLEQLFTEEQPARTSPFGRIRQARTTPVTADSTRELQDFEDAATLAPPSNKQAASETDSSATNRATAPQQAKAQQKGERSDEKSPPGESPDTDSNNSPNQNSSAPPQTNEREAKDERSSGSLLSKMKDAMANMMAKMRPDGQSAKSPGADKNAAAENKSAEMPAKGKKSEQAPSEAQNKQNSGEAEARGEEGAKTTETPQSAQSKSSDQADTEKGADSHSGIGRQDGSKEMNTAEQQKAMGKLAEIIGKRSQSVTGDMTVQTSSAPQRLQTDWTGQVGTHQDNGGEINRDRVPPMYRSYVRRYMEMVRAEDQATRKQP